MAWMEAVNSAIANLIMYKQGLMKTVLQIGLWYIYISYIHINSESEKSQTTGLDQWKNGRASTNVGDTGPNDQKSRNIYIK